jgi:hypothetical protein
VTETKGTRKGARRGGQEAQEGRRLGNEETPVPRGEKLRSAAVRSARAGRSSARETRAGSRSQPWGKESLGGRNVTRASAASGISVPRGADSRGEQSSGAELGGWRLAAPLAGGTAREQRPGDGCGSSRRIQALKTKPQERSRSSRGGLGGAVGSNPPRASKGARYNEHPKCAEGGRWRGWKPREGRKRAATLEAVFDRIRRAGSAVEDQSPGGES